MRRRFQHAEHVLRVAGVFAVGFAVFLVLRWAVIPKDFGVYGFYRAGALNDIKAKPIAYAGRPACESCHHDTYVLRKDWPKIPAGQEAPEDKHQVLSCEACHGPLGAHAKDEKIKVAKVGEDKLCLTCHREIAGRPKKQPQVVPGPDHGDNGRCISCHTPHFPKPKPEEDEK
jgi:predicted CXXCH cytochrome family protein